MSDTALPLVQHCGACARTEPIFRGICLACGALDVSVRPCAAEGEVRSVTVLHRRTGEGVSEPVTIGLVRVAGGAKLMGQLPVGTRMGDTVNLADCRFPAGGDIVRADGPRDLQPASRKG